VLVKVASSFGRLSERVKSDERVPA
jgi:hypothetical protein